MIQRIQTVYLALGALVLGALFLFDALWQSEAAATLAWFSPATLLLAVVAAVGAVAAIFLYKNRAQQRKVVLGVQLLTVVLILLLVVGLFLTGELNVGPGGYERLLMLLPPVVAYIFFYLARKGIEGDIALVRSMDRLR